MGNREIKFRGLDENGIWIYGCLVNNMWTYSELTNMHREKVCEIITGDYGSDNWAEAIEEESNLITVKNETAGQYTGLKDKNGKEIYEGDIIGGFPHGTVTVRWCDEYACFECFWTDDYFDIFDEAIEKEITSLFANELKDCKDAWEVIGNIYENPELLK